MRCKRLSLLQRYGTPCTLILVYLATVAASAVSPGALTLNLLHFELNKNRPGLLLQRAARVLSILFVLLKHKIHLNVDYSAFISAMQESLQIK